MSRVEIARLLFYLGKKEEMKMKKLISLMAVCLLLTGCGSDSGSDSSKDTFTVGMECNYAPYNWQTNQETDSSVSLGGAGSCDGYDVMVSKQIADSLGKELVIKKLEWDGLEPALKSGTIDAIIAGMTASEDREQGIDFTTPYYDSEMVLIVRKDDALANATSIQDFSGKSVIGQMSTNYDTVIDQISGVNHLTPKGSYPEMIIALNSGEADAITAEVPVAMGVVNANPNLTYVKFEKGKGFDGDNSISIGLPEGSRGTDVFDAVQKALDKITTEQRTQFMEKAVKIAPTGE